MPELPEVETVARLVRPHLVGRAVTDARVLWERSLGGPGAEAFARDVQGLRLDTVSRRGKHVVIEVSRDGVPCGALVVHLRMTGRLHVEPHDQPPSQYLRVALALDDGTELRFVDVRKFGRFARTLDARSFLGHLGPEPLDEHEFTDDWFAGALRARRRALKPLLLDQTFRVGLGNIYVDESLHRSGLHPLRRADRVTRKQAVALRHAIHEVLTEAIRREGSSFDTFYRTPEGNPGSYQDQFLVYGRHGRPCRTCERTIERLVVGQRGTHVCTRCQPAPRRRAAPVPRARRATLDDVRAIARISVDGWRAAYRGVVPDEFLTAISVSKRQELWERLVTRPPEERHGTFVIARGDDVLGFACGGAARDDALDDDRVGEVHAIYMRPDAVGTGLGRRLFAHVLRHLERRAFEEVVVWVLADNPRARHFYEAAGFRADGGATQWRGGGAELPEVRYRRRLAP